MASKLKTVVVLLLASLFACPFMLHTVYANPKSLYVIASINMSPTPVQAYDVQAGGSLVYQTTYNVPYYGIGAVGITIDSTAQVLFVTYESSNTIQLLNAVTMTSLGTTTAPGAYNLAGIVVDEDAQKVYTVDRNTDNLYVYDWNAVTKTLTLNTQVNLPGVTAAYGLALDKSNDLIYVGNNVAANNVRVFSTSDWSSVASYTVSQSVMGIALDTINQIFYTGNAYPGYGSTGLLCKYDMNTNTETTLNIRALAGGTATDNVVGLAVDPDTGILYITTGNQGSGGSDRMIAFNSNLNVLYTTGDIGDPTGICIPTEGVSYNPLSLSKTDNPDPVTAGNQITYTISFDNALNNYAVNNVVIVDTLPVETDFVSASNGGTYDAVNHKVTWNIGTLPAGAPQSSVTLVVSVDPATVPGSTLDNSVTIDSDETPPTTQHAFTTVRVVQQVIPEVPIGTIVVSASMIVALLAYFALPKLTNGRRKRIL